MDEKKSKFDDLDLVNSEIINEFHKSLEKLLEDTKSLIAAANICAYVAILYRTIHDNSQDSNLREILRKEAEYFIEQGINYVKSYNFQREILPEQFNPDIPVR